MREVRGIAGGRMYVTKRVQRVIGGGVLNIRDVLRIMPLVGRDVRKAIRAVMEGLRIKGRWRSSQPG